MDKLLSAILAADSPESVKQQFYQKIKDASAESQSPAVVTQILTISSNMALDCDSRSRIGAEIFTTWGAQNPSVLNEYLNRSFVLRLLDGRSQYATTAVRLLHNSIQILSDNKMDIEPHAQVIRAKTIGFIRETNNVDTLDALMKFLVNFNSCLPTNEYWPTLCLALIQAISRLPLPKDESELVGFIKSVGLFAGFTSRLWSKQKSTLNRALGLILEIVARKEGEQEPSVALAAVIQLIPVEIIPEAVESVMNDQTLDETNLTAALNRLVNWLGWITATNLPTWILAFLRGLARAKKYAILITVTLTKVQVVFDCIRFAQLRANTLPVLSLILLSFQHSPQAFHKIAESLPSTVALLREENTEESTRVLLELNDLARTLMAHFSGFPDLYEPILEALKDLEEPSAEKQKSLLSENKWSAQATSTPTVVSLPKSETGKVGLDNLGNTCYVNSVIQAMFMCDELRSMVFANPAYSLHCLPGKLQQLFAFLKLSERASYCPRDFVHASRPAWFLPGQQNDCSEYLKYLLDQLNEAQKTSRKTLDEAQKTSRKTHDEAQKASRKTQDEAQKTRRKNHDETQKTRTEKTEPLLRADGDFAKSDNVRFERGDKTKGSEGDMETVEMDVGQNSEKVDFDAPSCSTGTRTEEPMEVEQSLTSIEHLFLGKSETSVTCLDCGSQSCRSENFFDLSLAFPESDVRAREDQPTLVGGDSSAACTAISEVQELAVGDSVPLEKLIHYYLQPEILKDDNQYHCINCDKLRDAERTVSITRAPRYLLLTLLRFSYDAKTQSRTKLLTDVTYPLSLILSTNQKPKSHKRKHSNPEEEEPTHNFAYQLNSVVVHSGMSSDCGHYYTYARHLNSCESAAPRWYQFNDDRVSFASYDSFTSLNRRFRLDTPYVLVYRRSGEDLPDDPDMDQILVSAVERDNALYRQDLEGNKKKVRFNLGPKGPGDQDDPPGGCGLGGFPGLNGGARFVF